METYRIGVKHFNSSEVIIEKIRLLSFVRPQYNTSQTLKGSITSQSTPPWSLQYLGLQPQFISSAFDYTPIVQKPWKSVVSSRISTKCSVVWIPRYMQSSTSFPLLRHQHRACLATPDEHPLAFPHIPTTRAPSLNPPYSMATGRNSQNAFLSPSHHPLSLFQISLITNTTSRHLQYGLSSINCPTHNLRLLETLNHQSLCCRQRPCCCFRSSSRAKSSPKRILAPPIP